MAKISRMDDQTSSNFIADHNSGMGPTLLSKKYGFCETSIKNYLHKNNCYVYKNPNAFKKKYSCNDQYFAKINDPIKAYWLGFIITDGCITKNRLAIFLQRRDEGHLELFKSDIQSNGKIIRIKKKAAGIVTKYNKYEFYDQSYLGIYSKILTSDLAKYGVIPNKTYSVKYPKNISPEFHRDFIRGVVDGDGCIYKGKKSQQVGIGIYGTHALLKSIQKILVKNCNVNFNKIIHIKNIYKLTYHGNKSATKICSFLYDGATRFLERKINKILE
tara:strand:+ start:351 stop:1169 length:819 start_codon:yes stop_codon:yes gene_type:complete